MGQRRACAHPAHPRRHAPYIGEHTDDMLGALGFTPVEIAGLKADGAVPKPAGPEAIENTREGRKRYGEKMAARRAKAAAERRSKL